MTEKIVPGHSSLVNKGLVYLLSISEMYGNKTKTIFHCMNKCVSACMITPQYTYLLPVMPLYIINREVFRFRRGCNCYKFTCASQDVLHSTLYIVVQYTYIYTIEDVGSNNILNFLG